MQVIQILFRGFFLTWGVRTHPGGTSGRGELGRTHFWGVNFGIQKKCGAGKKFFWDPPPPPPPRVMGFEKKQTLGLLGGNFWPTTPSLIIPPHSRTPFQPTRVTRSGCSGPEYHLLQPEVSKPLHQPLPPRQDGRLPRRQGRVFLIPTAWSGPGCWAAAARPLPKPHTVIGCRADHT